MMQNTHRRPVEHWRRVQTKRGKRAVLVNRGLKYPNFVSKRMKSPEIRKLPVNKRMSAIAKEWNAMKTKVHMAKRDIRQPFLELPGEKGAFQTYKQRPGGFTPIQRPLTGQEATALQSVLGPSGRKFDVQKYAKLDRKTQRIIFPHLPREAKGSLALVRKVLFPEQYRDEEE